MQSRVERIRVPSVALATLTRDTIVSSAQEMEIIKDLFDANRIENVALNTQLIAIRGERDATLRQLRET